LGFGYADFIPPLSHVIVAFRKACSQLNKYVCAITGSAHFVRKGMIS